MLPELAASAKFLTLTLPLAFDAKAKALLTDDARAMLAGIADALEASDFSLEAINAVLHGNEYDPARQIAVALENTGKALVFTIADQGDGFNPESVPDPLAPENLMRGTGRGIFLIRSLMDEVKFRQLHPGTELTLVKHLAVAGEKK